MLSELEFHVLSYLSRAPGREGYGWRIRRWMLETLGLDVRYGTLYRTLAALHVRGWLDVRVGEADDKLAGGSRKYYRLNDAGAEALSAGEKQMSELVQRLQKSLPRVTPDT